MVKLVLLSPFLYDVCSLRDKYWLLLPMFVVQEAIYSTKYNLFGWIKRMTKRYPFFILKSTLVSGFDVEHTLILDLLMIYCMIGDLYRRRPCLMLGMRCCQFYIWWQCYHYHRLTCCCFQDHHPMMVISPKYQKVGSRNTAKDLVPVIKFIASSWISFWLIYQTAKVHWNRSD